MSIVDELDLNGKFRLVLMETIDIPDPARHEKALNSCNAISGAQVRKLLAYFNLTDEVKQKGLNNLEGLWGVFQSVRKARGTGEYIRDQIQLVINIGDTRTTRIYVRGVRDRKEEVLAELETIRGAGDLLELLGPVEAATINRRKFTPRTDRKPGNHTPRPGGNGGQRNYSTDTGHSERHQPFDGLRDKLQGRGQRERGDRRQNNRNSAHA